MRSPWHSPGFGHAWRHRTVRNGTRPPRGRLTPRDALDSIDWQSRTC
jgi:hypothetical protein